MRTLYLVSKRLPRVCMGGSRSVASTTVPAGSAPRVHGWFSLLYACAVGVNVCPACAWVVPLTALTKTLALRLPRVCMGGSLFRG